MSEVPINRVICGDALEVLRGLPDGCIDLCVTSPPYWGLRDYGVDGQLGLEPNLSGYVANMVAVFAEVRRVLKGTGSLYLNLGDSYARNPEKGGNSGYGKHAEWCGEALHIHDRAVPSGLKPKDLCGVPWRVALALQADGWYLREDIIWAKPNTMPESVTDRCTRSHEYLFHLTKSARYWYDASVVAEPSVADHPSGNGYARPHRISIGGRGSEEPWVPCGRGGATAFRGQGHFREDENGPANRDGRDMKDVGAGPTRNLRDVWTINTAPFPGAHFATFPPALVRPCVRAACPSGGVVLDPFMGSGTVGMVAVEEGRRYIGIELNPEYVAMAERRIVQAQPALEVTA